MDEAYRDPIAQLEPDKLPAVAEHLDTARADVLAFTSFPKEVWRQIRSNNPSEQLNREIRSGQYFYADVKREGVMLYDSRRVELAQPKALSGT